jgi:hypothetical protein
MKHLGVGMVAVAVLVMPRIAAADVASVETFGLSAHLGTSYTKAPRRLDSDGVYVFNPGLGIAWDFRDHVSQRGFAPTVGVGWWQDCADRAVFAIGAGVRYTHVLPSGWTFGGSLAITLINGEVWDTQPCDRGAAGSRDRGRARYRA